MVDTNYDNIMFQLNKVSKFAELTFKYYECARQYDMIGAMHCLMQSHVIAATYFVPGDKSNTIIDAMYVHRMCNQIKINLMWCHPGGLCNGVG